MRLDTFALAFLVWTLGQYWLHRLAHIRHPLNILGRIHLSHHKIDYSKGSRKRPLWYNFLHYYGSIAATLDVYCIQTLPALLVTVLWGWSGFLVLLFHYLYEVFLADGLADHNPAIGAPWIGLFAWGWYHLHHHRDFSKNFSFSITLWDHLFGTAHTPSKNPYSR